MAVIVWLLYLSVELVHSTINIVSKIPAYWEKY